MENRFDLYELPEGHEVRFEEKYDKRLTQQRRRRIVFRWTASAAVLAAIVALSLPGNRSSVQKARTPESVYTAYLEQVGELYALLASQPEEDGVDREAVLHELTDETIPLYDQLPEEMPEREKTAILKEYYGDILNEAYRLSDNNNIK